MNEITIIAFVFNLAAIVSGIFWIINKVDKRVDERIELSGTIDSRIDNRIENHPLIKQYILFSYKLEVLEKETKEIKQIVQNIAYSIGEKK